MWLALARLHAAHRDPVGRLVPFERPEALLSLTKQDDLLFTARVELSGDGDDGPPPRPHPHGCDGTGLARPLWEPAAGQA